MRVATLRDYRLLPRGVWSPRGTLLPIKNSSGLSIFDAGHPDVAPRLILPGPVASAWWSPDGSWLVGEVIERRAPEEVLCWVIAASADGGMRDTLRFGRDLGPCYWGDDGAIYVWTSSPSAARIKLAPPRGWRPRSRPAHPRPVPILSTLVPALLAPYDLCLDVLPDGRHFIARSGMSNFVVDDQGEVTDSLGSTISWNSVSADGRFLIGYHEVDAEAGENIASARLFVGDVHGKWILPIRGARSSVEMRMSRQGSLLAFNDFDSRTLLVGRLDVTPPR